LDNTFGTGGKVTTLVGSSCHAYATAIQPDGKILVAGNFLGSIGHAQFLVIRYNSNGTLDNTFASNGIAAVDFGVDAVAYGIAIQSDGKIVVVGSEWTNNGDFAVARLNTDGTLDNSFGVFGRTNTDPNGLSTDVARSVAIQTDGKIVVAGYTTNPHNDGISVVRYNSNGSLDNSFNGNGIVNTQTTTVANSTHTWNIASLPAGAYYLLIDDKKKKTSLRFVKE